jgi:hypothetical protein
MFFTNHFVSTSRPMTNLFFTFLFSTLSLCHRSSQLLTSLSKQIGSIMFPPGLLCNVYTGDHCSGSSETLNSPGSANLFNGRAIEERLKSFECKHITNSA